MSISFGKPESDPQAERVKQAFNNASSGNTPPSTSRGGAPPPPPPKNPEQILKPAGVTEQEAQAAAGLSAQQVPEPSNSLENEREDALGLDKGLDLGLGL